MSLPEVDPRRRALPGPRQRRANAIAQDCPEWTEVNVSDPGITLIELFAWMTDMLCYRINRLPEKLHVALLSLLGVKLLPPLAARAELCFRLDGRPTGPRADPARDGGRHQENPDAGVRRLPARPRASRSSRCGWKACCAPARPRQSRGVGVPPSDGAAQPVGEDSSRLRHPAAARRPPAARLQPSRSTACWCGSKSSASRRAGRGSIPGPPLVWEVSPPRRSSERPTRAGDGSRADARQRLHQSLQQEEGLDRAPAAAEHGPGRSHGAPLPLLAALPGVPTSDNRSLPPQIPRFTAAPVGATVPAEHCQACHRASRSGNSDGTPGETFELRHPPILAPTPTSGWKCAAELAWVPWERVRPLPKQPARPPLLLDETAGEIQLGPAVRQHDGAIDSMARHCCPQRAEFSQYRHGGGRVGNVAAGTLTQLREPIPRVRR